VQSSGSPAKFFIAAAALAASRETIQARQNIFLRLEIRLLRSF
jgi:hypothetical protein